MRLRRHVRAGLYADARYKRGLRAYRRRVRWPLLIVVLPMFVFFWGVTLTRKLDAWSLAAGAAATTAVALISFVRDEPPQHVTNWRRGAEGERKTEKALRPLERQGWQVEHDIQMGRRANLDHVVIGPPGVFLLETKNAMGTITFEDGVLVARQFDDPDAVFRYRTLAPRLLDQARDVSVRLREQTARRVWVNAVVVIWGYFPAGYVEHEKVVYIRGDRLKEWLASFEPSRSMTFRA